jgi:hypothetical protein
VSHSATGTQPVGSYWPVRSQVSAKKPQSSGADSKRRRTEVGQLLIQRLDEPICGGHCGLP